MTLVTSRHTYELVSFYELEEKYQKKAKKEFDWIEDLEDSYGFFVYKKELYHLGQFMRNYEVLKDEKTGKKFRANGIYNWSYFNGIAVEFVNSNAESVKVAYFY